MNGIHVAVAYNVTNRKLTIYSNVVQLFWQVNSNIGYMLDNQEMINDLTTTYFYIERFFLLPWSLLDKYMDFFVPFFFCPLQNRA